MKPFVDVLRERELVIFDGAMGTQLEARGAPVGPAANLDAPDTVVAVHQSYLQAGATALLTNTLTANRLAQGTEATGELVERLNREGVRLCKKASEGRAYVVGDVGSTGHFLEPYGEYTEEQFFEVYMEQARVLSEEGVDAIAIETMTDDRELTIAIRACKEASGLPVIGLMSFDPVADGYRTMMGVSPAQAAEAVVAAGADAVGANCGTVGPMDVAEIVRAMKAVTDLPLMAEPNAGKPLLSGGVVTYTDISVEEYANGCEAIVAAGATLIGGCCGTDPRHIAALAEKLG